jgi:hypothetical protein
MADKGSLLSLRARYIAPLRLLVLLGFGLMLGACSKCDFPTPWEHSSAGSTPAACHDSPQTH